MKKQSVFNHAFNADKVFITDIQVDSIELEELVKKISDSTVFYITNPNTGHTCVVGYDFVRIIDTNIFETLKDSKYVFIDFTELQNKFQYYDKIKQYNSWYRWDQYGIDLFHMPDYLYYIPYQFYDKVFNASPYSGWGCSLDDISRLQPEKYKHVYSDLDNKVHLISEFFMNQPFTGPAVIQQARNNVTVEDTYMKNYDLSKFNCHYGYIFDITNFKVKKKYDSIEYEIANNINKLLDGRDDNDTFDSVFRGGNYQRGYLLTNPLGTLTGNQFTLNRYSDWKTYLGEIFEKLEKYNTKQYEKLLSLIDLREANKSDDIFSLTIYYKNQYSFEVANIVNSNMTFENFKNLSRDEYYDKCVNILTKCNSFFDSDMITDGVYAKTFINKVVLLKNPSKYTFEYKDSQLIISCGRNKWKHSASDKLIQYFEDVMGKETCDRLRCEYFLSGGSAE